MEKAAALKQVEAYLTTLAVGKPYELVVLEDLTRDEDFGWIFLNSERNPIVRLVLRAIRRSRAAVQRVASVHLQ